MSRFSIANTTRKEREEIIRRSLDCGGGGCESCSGCGVLGAGNPYAMYQPYIDGKMELAEINMSFRPPFSVKS